MQQHSYVMLIVKNVFMHIFLLNSDSKAHGAVAVAINQLLFNYLLLSYTKNFS